MKNTKILKKKKDLSATIFIIIMLIVPIISFLFFYVYINFNSILLAFRIPKYDGLGSFEVGLGNFETVFKQFTNTNDKIFSYFQVVILQLDNFILFNKKQNRAYSCAALRKNRCYRRTRDAKRNYNNKYVVKTHVGKRRYY